MSQGVFESQMLTNALYVEKKNNYEISFFCEGKQLKENNKYKILRNRKELWIHIKSVDYVYTRHIKGFYEVFFYKKIFFHKFKVLFDFRGFNTYERLLKYETPPKLKLRFNLAVERFIFKKADQVNVVSNTFAQVIEEHFGKREKDKATINVIPCGIDEAVEKKFQNNSKEIKFVYCGSLSKWQKFSETLDLYKKISIYNENVSLTIFTGDLEEAKKIAQKKELKDIKVLSLKREDLLKELPKFDFGFLLRDHNYVNKVASPIKFIEYVSRGVIPIMSDNIGDYSNIVKERNLGIIVDENLEFNFSLIDETLNDLEINKRLYKLSEEYLWENIFQKTSLII
jgi:hypothetical protein